MAFTGDAGRARGRRFPNTAIRPMLPAMITFLTVLLGLAMAGVLAVLFAGLIGVVRGGGDPRRSNALMRWRVILQGAALLLFMLLLSLLHR
jgi:hypothetical protein